MRPDVRVSLRGLRRGYELTRAGGVRHVVIDVDGCLTSGLQLVTPTGEKIKAFGLDDRAAIERWSDKFPVTLITSDMALATVLRAKSWGVPLFAAPATPHERLTVISHVAADLRYVVYIADGYHDAAVMQHVAFGIAPADAWPATRRQADAVTGLPGGRRAVAQALDFCGKWLTR